MNEAELYSKYSDMQKTDTALFLDKYMKLVKWKEEGNDTVLDVGCASGDVLLHLLVPRLPNNFKKLVGMDISQKMLRFARNRTKDSRITYQQMDIGTEGKIDPDLLEEFDHIFSFYCLHWIQNQRQVMKNLLKMLKPGGDILTLFVVNHPIYDVYHGLVKNNKWSQYMEGFKEYVSPYQFSENPKEQLEKHLEGLGFQTEHLTVENRDFTFKSMSNFKKASIAVIPFYKKIPENMRKEFFDDYLEQHRKLKCVKWNPETETEEVCWTYRLFILYGNKIKS